MTIIRNYRELRRLETFEERFRYLSLHGMVGNQTFGFDRYINQQFYRSKQWRDLRHHIIARDEACDLGVPGFEIHDRIIIHHMNPMTLADIVEDDESILDPDVLVSVSHRTHNAIHYGNESLLPREYRERRAGDTQLWRRRY